MIQVEHILRSKSITEYLEKRGHMPFKSLTGGKFAYLCPIPDHKDSKPSFIVWTNAEFENFHCFGCSRGHNIIHLVSFIEGISFREAFRKLSDGMEVALDDDIDLILQKIEKDVANPMFGPYSPEIDLATCLSSMSSLCRSYINGTGGDPVEVEIIDKFWEQIDKDISSAAFDEVENSLSVLPSFLSARLEKVKLQQQQMQMKANLL